MVYNNNEKSLKKIKNQKMIDRRDKHGYRHPIYITTFHIYIPMLHYGLAVRFRNHLVPCACYYFRQHLIHIYYWFRTFVLYTYGHGVVGLGTK